MYQELWKILKIHYLNWTNPAEGQSEEPLVKCKALLWLIGPSQLGYAKVCYDRCEFRGVRRRRMPLLPSVLDQISIFFM